MLHCADSVTDVSEDSNAYIFLDRFTLNMEALRSLQKMVTIYQLKRSNITENFNILKKNMSWVIFIIIIINILSFMYGIYTYIPETNHVPRGYSVAAILSIHSLVPIYFVPALVL